MVVIENIHFMYLFINIYNYKIGQNTMKLVKLQ